MIAPSIKMANVEGLCFQPVSRQDEERLQRYHAKLRVMRDQLSEEYRDRLNERGLEEIASSLLDGAVFEIVKELEEIQQLNERSLLSKRMKAVGVHKSRRMELSRKHKEEMATAKPHNLPLITSRQQKERSSLDQELKDEIVVIDRSIIQELDQLATEQQSTLQQAAVPFFSITSKLQDIQLQMHLLHFIQTLAQEQHE